MKSKDIILAVTVLSISLVLISLIESCIPKKNINSKPEVVENIPVEVVISNEPFTKEALVKLIRELNLKHPEIVLAQTILETGDYKSKIFTENHNLFGMKEASSRIHLAKGTRYGHAYYNSWKESVYDYSFYQASYLRGKTKRAYYKYLSSSYATDPQYTSKLKKLIEENMLKQFFNDK